MHRGDMASYDYIIRQFIDITAKWHGYWSYDLNLWRMQSGMKSSSIIYQHNDRVIDDITMMRDSSGMRYHNYWIYLWGEMKQHHIDTIIDCIITKCEEAIQRRVEITCNCAMLALSVTWKVHYIAKWVTFGNTDAGMVQSDSLDGEEHDNHSGIYVV